MFGFIIIWGRGGGGVIFLCLPPYNMNFRYFDIKSLVPRALNSQDSTVFSYNKSRCSNNILANV